LPAAFNLCAKREGAGLRKRGNRTEPSGVGHRRRKLGASHPHHSALNYRIPNCQQFRDAGLHRSHLK